MEFRILGALEAYDGERSVPLGGPKPRALLAVLLLHADEVVPTARLVEELWGEIGAHRAHLEETGTLTERRARNLAGEVFAVASARAKTRLQEAVAEDDELRRLLGEVQRRELDPLTAVREIMETVFRLRDDDGDRPDTR